jgi:L-iditol 2-dehydrogenase
LLKAVVSGPRRAELAQVPDPRAKDDWALVKVHVAPMCTEYKSFVAGGDARFLGHEAAGEVVDVGPCGTAKVGDRVVAMPLSGCGHCRTCLSGDYIYCQRQPNYAALHGSLEGSATMSQYILKQSWLLCPIPDHISYEMASLACCALGPSYGAYQRMNVGASETLLITGAGPVGLGAIVNAVFRRCRVIVVEGQPYRVDKAKELGAEAVLDPRDEGVVARIREMTGGWGVDKALDCSGVPEAQRICIDATRRLGQVAFVGECYDRKLEITVSPDMIRKGLTILGSWHYNLADYPGVMDVIRRSSLAPQVISHEIPMSRIQEAMELSASQQCAKILLKPWE